MKKIIAFMLAAAMILSMAGCGSSKDKNTDAKEFASAEVLLTEIHETFKENEQFPIGGGDPENVTMDKPGKFDVTMVEDMEAMLGLPKEQAANIDDAATMVHLMNANTFTAAAYHLKKDVDVNEFTEALKTNILAKQWLCGMPDQLFIMDGGDGYVLAAFGEEQIMEMFKTHSLEVLGKDNMLVEEQITENF